jgi:hypothetical protein
MISHEVQQTRNDVMFCSSFPSVIPAKAGIQEIYSRAFWIPAFAVMTS